MRKELLERVVACADYIIDTKDTIRDTAKEFNISKSTVHKDIQQRLIEIDEKRYEQVQEIFKNHIEVRHIRGGQSTKNKYLSKKL